MDDRLLTLRNRSPASGHDDQNGKEVRREHQIAFGPILEPAPLSTTSLLLPAGCFGQKRYANFSTPGSVVWSPNASVCDC